jgi:hypothetical protein
VFLLGLAVGAAVGIVVTAGVALITINQARRFYRRQIAVIWAVRVAQAAEREPVVIPAPPRKPPRPAHRRPPSTIVTQRFDPSGFSR